MYQDTAYLKLDSLTEEWKRQFQEDSWFLEAVKRVRGSWEDMGLESVMLVFRLGLGSLVTDEEVRESVSCPLLRDLIASAEKTTSQGEESREKGAS